MDDKEHDTKGKKPDTLDPRPQIERPIRESSEQEGMRPSVNDEERVTPIGGGGQGSKK
jgi:hypothetical protein